MDHLLSKYRAIQHFFPFVLIPEEWTAEAMLQGRAFLLLATLTVVASRHASLQARLTHELQEQLAAQYVTEGESSLDLLQGLLVHLAWYGWLRGQ